MTKSLFEHDNQMAKCDPATGKYIACSLLYQGDMTPR